MPGRTIRLAYLGFGTVGRTLHALLAMRRDALAFDYLVTGVATRRGGWRADARGLDPERPRGDDAGSVDAWLAAARPDVVLESIVLDPHRGQPALDHLRAVLASGAHAISANKGPVVHGYRELSALAARVGRQYRFESAVMDGAPVFSLVRECLPLAGLRAVHGIFTSTATVVLEAMEEGLGIAEGIARAQRLGIAEADPSYDVDGWDSAVKLCALANVLLDADLRPAQVARTGLRALDPADVRRARDAGHPYRLVGRVAADAAGSLAASVAPERCAPDDPLGAVRGTSLVMHYTADVFPGGLTVTSRDPDPTTTAYGMLTDLIAVAGTG